MKNLHGIAREVAIDEMLNRKALLDKAAREWGFEYEGTIKLYEMEQTSTYKEMMAYYKEQNDALTEDEEF